MNLHSTEYFPVAIPIDFEPDKEAVPGEIGYIIGDEDDTDFLEMDG